MAGNDFMHRWMVEAKQVIEKLIQQLCIEGDHQIVYIKLLNFTVCKLHINKAVFQRQRTKPEISMENVPGCKILSN